MFTVLRHLFIGNPGQTEFVASAYDVLEYELKRIAPTPIPPESEPARENSPPYARIMVSHGQGLRFRSFVLAL